MVYLKTKRLIMRDPIVDDIGDLHKLMSDMDTMYYIQDIATSSYEETRTNVMKTISQIGKLDRERYFLTIIEKESDKFIGSVGYTVEAFTPLGKIVKLGYFLLPDYHSKGYMTEAVNEMVNYAFLDNDVCRISTGCLKENVGSERVMKKCGFKKEAHYKEYIYHDCKLKDRVEYRLLLSEYRKVYNEDSYT